MQSCVGLTVSHNPGSVYPLWRRKHWEEEPLVLSKPFLWISRAAVQCFEFVSCCLFQLLEINIYSLSKHFSVVKSTCNLLLIKPIIYIIYIYMCINKAGL